MSLAKSVTAVTLCALAALSAGCGKQSGPTTSPKSGEVVDNCIAADGIPAAQRADLYVKLASSLETVGLEFHGIDAAGAVVFVPKGLCTRPGNASGVPPAQRLANANYTSSSCGEPPIVIYNACIRPTDPPR